MSHRLQNSYPRFPFRAEDSPVGRRDSLRPEEIRRIERDQKCSCLLAKSSSFQQIVGFLELFEIVDEFRQDLFLPPNITNPDRALDFSRCSITSFMPIYLEEVTNSDTSVSLLYQELKKKANLVDSKEKACLVVSYLILLGRTADSRYG